MKYLLKVKNCNTIQNFNIKLLKLIIMEKVVMCSHKENQDMLLDYKRLYILISEPTNVTLN